MAGHISFSVTPWTGRGPSSALRSLTFTDNACTALMRRLIASLSYVVRKVFCLDGVRASQMFSISVLGVPLAHWDEHQEYQCIWTLAAHSYGSFPCSPCATALPTTDTPHVSPLETLLVS